MTDEEVVANFYEQLSNLINETNKQYKFSKFNYFPVFKT